MQEWLAKFLKQEPSIPRPLYSLERENELLHDMVREIAEQRNEYRIENQRLMDENAMLKRIIELYALNHAEVISTEKVVKESRLIIGGNYDSNN